MKALLALHSRVTANHVRRRLRYLSIYFDWAGTITYLYVGAFFLLLLAYYLYDPAARIPYPIRHNIVLAATAILVVVPGWWLAGGFVFAEKSSILVSTADVHFLPLVPIDKAKIICEQWLWAALKRSALALAIPLLTWLFLRLFQPDSTFEATLATQVIWLLTGILGLSLQWLGAYLIELLQPVYRWLKGLFTVGVLLAILSGTWRLLSSGQGLQYTIPPTPTLVAPLPATFSVPWLDWPASVWITLTSLTIILTALALLLYTGRKWEPTLRQSQHVLTIRTLMRARDKRALQRYRRSMPGWGILSRLLTNIYASPNWALTWKNILSWRQINWTQVLFSFTLPTAVLILVRLGIIPALPRSGDRTDVLLHRIFLNELPMAMLVLQAFTEFLRSWQDDLQHAEIFGLLPIDPRQVILSTVLPSAALTGGPALLITLLIAPLRGINLFLASLLAPAEIILAVLLVAREILKDPSASTSLLGPERWLSGLLLLLAPAIGQLSFLWGWTLYQSLLSALIIALGLAFLLYKMMVNELVLLRSRYGL